MPSIGMQLVSERTSTVAFLHKADRNASLRLYLLQQAWCACHWPTCARLFVRTTVTVGLERRSTAIPASALTLS